MIGDPRASGAGTLIPPSSLLYPAWRGFANRIRRLDGADRGKVTAAVLLVAAVWIGLYFGIRALLEACYGIELFGEFLVDRLLALVFLSFSGILLFSNVVTGLASFYLSDDLSTVNALPADRLRVFYARFVQTVIGSSWMVLLFGAPVLLAYGTVHRAGPLYYLVVAAVAPSYFLLPAAAAVALITVLVNVFPARRARDLLMVLGVIFLGLGFLLFRAIEPERLVDPEAFESLAAFFGQLAVPEASWLPSTWATRALSQAMRGRSGWLEPTVHLVLTAGAATFACAWFTSALYFSGWSKAQEGRRAYLSRFRGDRLAWVAERVLGARGGAILAKDVRTFFRDAGQWSQLLLLAALVGIYLMSIKALPFDALEFPTGTYCNAVAFMNLGMGGFVLSALAARFLFPAVSAEGRGIWILRAAPMSARELVWSKFAAGVLPAIAVGELISISSNVLLQSSTFVLVSGAVTTALIAVAVSALAVGMGARMPDFKAENLAKVAAGFGGIVYMAGALAYIGFVVFLEAYPTYRIYDSIQYGYRLTPRTWMIIGGLYATVVVTTMVVAWTALERGAKSLEEREYA